MCALVSASQVLLSSIDSADDLLSILDTQFLQDLRIKDSWQTLNLSLLEWCYLWSAKSTMQNIRLLKFSTD